MDLRQYGRETKRGNDRLIMEDSPRPPRLHLELEAIVNRSPAMVFLWKARDDWPLEGVSENIRRMGYEPGDFREGTIGFKQLIHPGDLDRVQREIEEHRRRGNDALALEYRILFRDGTARWVDARMALRRDPAGTVTHVQGVLLDITERVDGERTRALQNATHHDLFTNWPEAIVLLDLEDRVLAVNKAFEALFQYTQEEALGRPINDLVVPPERRAEALGLTHRAFSGMSIESESVRKRKDGTLVDVSILGHPVRAGGERVAYYAIYRDITERKLAEKALIASEERYRLVVNHSNDAIFVVQDGFIRFCNPKIREITGYTEEEILSLPMSRLIHPEDRDLVVERHQRRLRGEPVPNTYSFRALGRNGRTIWVHISAVLIDWEGRPASLNFVRDITHEKAMEAQLVQAQKMEAVGTLAGGIAHDFNNLLQAVQGYAELLLLGSPKGDPAAQNLKEIVNCARKGKELTHQLLTFSRKVESRLRRIDLNRQVQNVHKLLERTLPKMIRIEVELDPALRTIQGDPGQIEQVIINLAVNAKDAMPSGGTLTLRTRNVPAGDTALSGSGPPGTGPQVLLSISDTGHGMDTRTTSRIFEPFFSTKGPGKGTGLGLAMVYGIVQNHGGHIECWSLPGEGTCFTLSFPAVSGDPEEHRESSLFADLPHGSGTILIVDDEPFVREFGREMLERFGYTVHTASNGEEAMEIYRNDPKAVDLVILDLIMPGMGGRKCLEEILAVDPDARIIVASGYSPHETARETLEAGARDFVSKPYLVQEILQKIHRALKR